MPQGEAEDKQEGRLKMEKDKIIGGVLANKELLKFCERILMYSDLLNGDSRNEFFASILNTDDLTDKESCSNVVEYISFMLHNVRLMELGDLEDETVDKLCDGFKVAASKMYDFMGVEAPAL